MFAHDVEFRCRQRACFTKNALGCANLADIVQQGAEPQFLEFGFCVCEQFAELHSIMGNGVRMAARVFVADVDGLCERERHIDVAAAGSGETFGRLLDRMLGGGKLFGGEHGKERFLRESLPFAPMTRATFASAVCTFASQVRAVV